MSAYRSCRWTLSMTCPDGSRGRTSRIFAQGRGGACVVRQGQLGGGENGRNHGAAPSGSAGLKEVMLLFKLSCIGVDMDFPTWKRIEPFEDNGCQGRKGLGARAPPDAGTGAADGDRTAQRRRGAAEIGGGPGVAAGKVGGVAAGRGGGPGRRPGSQGERMAQSGTENGAP